MAELRVAVPPSLAGSGLSATTTIGSFTAVTLVDKVPPAACRSVPPAPMFAVWRLVGSAVKVRLPLASIPRLQEHTFFYVYDEVTGLCRWMTAWDTTDADVDSFADVVREELQH